MIIYIEHKVYYLKPGGYDEDARADARGLPEQGNLDQVGRRRPRRESSVPEEPVDVPENLSGDL